MKAKLLILLVTTISMVGCTSIRPIDMEKVDLTEVLETGDRVIAYEKQGRVVDMTLTTIEDGVLIGSYTGSGMTTVEVNIEDIEKIEAEKISGAKTTGAVVGGLVLVPLVAAGAVIVGAGAVASQL
ncbi:MAG: hypothetical protein GWN47_09190 [Woeseiaceae bacterium]|nr:hypothetical protein [Woeseiaceae bacterium]